jgi:hypothetical protein
VSKAKWPDEYGWFLSYLSILYQLQTSYSFEMEWWYVLSRVRGSVTNNNGFWIGWLNLLTLLLQLHLITITYITAHNQWLSKTRSIPSWTVSVFSSFVIDLVLIYESLTSSVSVVRSITRLQSDWLHVHEWHTNQLCVLFYTSVRTEYRTLSSTVHVILCPPVAV